MTELTECDRRTLGQYPIGRLALTRIEELERELRGERVTQALLREKIALLEQTAQALALRVVQSENEARSAGGSGLVGCAGEPGDG